MVVEAAARQAEILSPLRRRTRQKELAAACGVAQSTVSDWFAGIKAPDEAHIALIWLATGADWHQLALAAGRDPRRVEMVVRSLQATRPAELIEYIEAELKEVPRQRQFTPDVKGAFDRAGAVVRLVERVGTRLPESPLKDELLTLMVRAVFEQAIALREMRGMGELPAESSRYAERLRADSQLCQRVEDLVVLSDLVTGHAYHVSRQYSQSVAILTAALAEHIDPEQRLLALSRVALGRAYSKYDDPATKKRVVKKLRDQAHRLLDRGEVATDTTLCAAEIGFARAMGAISPEEGLTILAEAEAVFSAMPPTEQAGPLIRLQLAGALAEIMMRHGPLDPSSRDLIIRINERALALAQQHHYDRFAEQARLNLARLKV